MPAVKKKMGNEYERGKLARADLDNQTALLALALTHRAAERTGCGSLVFVGAQKLVT